MMEGGPHYVQVATILVGADKRVVDPRSRIRLTCSISLAYQMMKGQDLH